MRLTIVDTQMAVVQDWFEVATVTPETFAILIENAKHYRNAGYRWFVTPGSEWPAHTRQGEFGRVY